MLHPTGLRRGARLLHPIFLLLVACNPPAALAPDVLARRVAASAPQWANYQEDIKAQIGAGPVARWEGKPLEGHLNGLELEIVFEVSGTWGEGEVSLPVLLRDHLGTLYRNHPGGASGGRVVYTFTLSDEAVAGAVPWVELKYPYHVQRLVFSSDGRWAAED